MPSYDSGKLLELAHLLVPDDPTLVEEVRLAVIDADDYVRQYRERLHGRGIDAPIPALPWIALADGLSARDRLREIDWKAELEDITWNLDQLAALRPEQPDRWTWLEEEAWQDKMPEDVLPAIGNRLLQNGMALVTLDIDSDSYLLVVLPADRSQESRRLAQLAGYGEILRWPDGDDR
jgi:hypothetical protein